MKKKVFVVGSDLNYADFIKDVTLTSNMKEADIVLFTGGEDVNPKLYGAKCHPSTAFNTNRDLAEVSVFKKIKPNQLAIGVCRGSQLMCVLNGGKLVQNCSNHALAGTHGITDGNVEYEITSTHHQMQYPYNLNEKDYTVLFTSNSLRSRCYEGDLIDPDIVCIKGEPEIVLYHKEGHPKCLAIQGHPEYMRPNAPVVEMLNNLINDILKTIENYAE